MIMDYTCIYINNLTSTGTYNVGLSEGLSINLFNPNFSHIFAQETIMDKEIFTIST